MLRGRSWDWAPGAEQRPSPGSLWKLGWWQHALEAPSKDRQKDMRSDRHTPLNCRPIGQGGKAAGRTPGLPLSPQEAIPFQSHTCQRYRVSSCKRAFTNWTLPLPSFQNSAALQDPNLDARCFHFAGCRGSYHAIQQLWEPPRPEHPGTELVWVLYSLPSAARQPQAHPFLSLFHPSF